MTIIFSNMGDQDCQTLRTVWEGLPNVNLIEITHDTENCEELVNTAIADEEDTLLFLGHGTGYGLMSPCFSQGAYLFHSGNLHLVKAKKVFCCWCHASTFCFNNRMHCFCTSMFISNIMEAYCNQCYFQTPEEVDDTARRFYQEVNDLLRNETPLEEWYDILTDNTDYDNDVDVFNREGLFYFE